MSTSNYNSSDLTNKRRNQMIYANFLIQQQQFNQGCSTRIILEGGSGARNQSSIYTEVQEATAETTLAEQTAILANNTCPVTTPPDPYLTDKIYLALTTNAAAYKAAAIGTWIAITAAEYASLKTALSGTTTVGLSDTNMGLDYTFSNLGGSAFVSNSYDGTNSVAIPASNYFFAVSFKYNVNNQTGNSVWVNGTSENAQTRTGFVKQGANLPTSVVPSGIVTLYYVYKGQSTATTASGTSSFAISDGNTNTGGLRLASGVTTSYYLFTATPSSSTVLSSRTLNTTGMQGISASSIQWVT